MRRLFHVAAILALAGCSQSTYESMHTVALCRNQLTKPPYNIHYKKIAAELKRRGASCEPYVDTFLLAEAEKDKARAIRAAAAQQQQRSRSISCRSTTIGHITSTSCN